MVPQAWVEPRYYIGRPGADASACQAFGASSGCATVWMGVCGYGHGDVSQGPPGLEVARVREEPQTVRPAPQGYNARAPGVMTPGALDRLSEQRAESSRVALGHARFLERPCWMLRIDEPAYQR